MTEDDCGYLSVSKGPSQVCTHTHTHREAETQVLAQPPSECWAVWHQAVLLTRSANDDIGVAAPEQCQSPPQTRDMAKEGELANRDRSSSSLLSVAWSKGCAPMTNQPSLARGKKAFPTEHLWWDKKNVKHTQMTAYLFIWNAECYKKRPYSNKLGQVKSTEIQVLKMGRTGFD